MRTAGIGSSKCKGPGAGTCLGCLRKSKEVGLEPSRVKWEEMRSERKRGVQIM